MQQQQQQQPLEAALSAAYNTTTGRQSDRHRVRLTVIISSSVINYASMSGHEKVLLHDDADADAREKQERILLQHNMPRDGCSKS